MKKIMKELAVQLFITAIMYLSETISKKCDTP